MTTGYKDTRRGWAWTLGRCGLATALLAAVGAGALYFLLTRLTLPWWVPEPVLAWLLATVRPYALLLGALLGGALGVPASVAIVVRDARKGRLSRVV